MALVVVGAVTVGVTADPAEAVVAFIALALGVGGAGGGLDTRVARGADVASGAVVARGAAEAAGAIVAVVAAAIAVRGAGLGLDTLAVIAEVASDAVGRLRAVHPAVPLRCEATIAVARRVVGAGDRLEAGAALADVP